MLSMLKKELHKFYLKIKSYVLKLIIIFIYNVMQLVLGTTSKKAAVASDGIATYKKKAAVASNGIATYKKKTAVASNGIATYKKKGTVASNGIRINDNKHDSAKDNCPVLIMPTSRLLFNKLTDSSSEDCYTEIFNEDTKDFEYEKLRKDWDLLLKCAEKLKSINKDIFS